MLTDYENIDFSDVDEGKKLFGQLLSEAKSIYENSQRTLNQRKKDQDQFSAQISDLQEKLDTLEKEREEFENKGLIHEGNFEELLEKKTEKLRLNYDEKLENSRKELDDALSKFSSLEKRYHNEKIHNVLRKVAEESGVIPSAIDDVLHRASGIFSIGEDGNIESRDNEGNLRKVGKQQLTPEVFVNKLKETAEHLWPVSEGASASGGSKNNGSGINPFDKKAGTWNLTEQAKLMNSDGNLFTSSLCDPHAMKEGPIPESISFS